jgi:hypothetical protein
MLMQVLSLAPEQQPAESIAEDQSTHARIALLLNVFK